MVKKQKKKKNGAMVSKATQDMVNVPEYLKGGKGRGTEKVEQSDIILPRIKLLQALSPEVVDGSLKAGSMCNSVTGDSYGEELSLIAVVHWKTRTMFDGVGADAGILCTSDDNVKPKAGVAAKPYSKECADCKKSQWKEDEKDKSPDCTLFYNFIVLLPEKGMTPVALSMSRTKIKTARKLLSVSRYVGAGKMDLFSFKFKLIIKSEKSPKGPFFNYDLVNDGFVSEQQFKQGEAIYKSMKDLVIKIHGKEDEEIEDDNSI